MAVVTYKCKLDRTDRIFNPSATFLGGVRVRPGETVEVDLEEPEQDDAFAEDRYDVSEGTPHFQPFETP